MRLEFVLLSIFPYVVFWGCPVKDLQFHQPVLPNGKTYYTYYNVNFFCFLISRSFVGVESFSKGSQPPTYLSRSFVGSTFETGLLISGGSHTIPENFEGE